MKKTKTGTTKYKANSQQPNPTVPKTSNMTNDKELLVAELYIKAVFPVIQVLLKEDPSTAKKFKDTVAKIVLRAKNDGGYIGATLHFNKGELEVSPEPIEGGDIVFTFGSVKKMTTFLKGGIALPSG